MRPDPQAPLDRLLAEVRAQRLPTTLEPGLPARLRTEFRSWASGPAGGHAGGGRAGANGAAVARGAVPWSRWLLAAALLGCVGLLLVWPAEMTLQHPPAQQSPSTPAAARPGVTYDGDALALDTPVVAGEQPSSVQHGSRASWVLAPGSRAQLLASGGVLRVSLELGSLEAQVQPSAQAESFVVQARGTEVAVHGTRFRVSLDGDSVHVAVAQGIVQVRPLGQSSGTVLRAHMQADFLAGAVLPAPASLAERSALPPEVVQAAAASRPSAVPSPASNQPSPLPSPPRLASTPAREPAGAAPAAAQSSVPAPPDAGERALRRVTEHVQSCFQRHLPGSGELGIEISTRLGLWVEASGQLLRADFDPPLAPAIEACVSEKLVQFRAAPSPEGYRVERHLLLHR